MEDFIRLFVAILSTIVIISLLAIGALAYFAP